MKNKIVDGFNHFLGFPGFDYQQISKLVYLGTNMCCQFGFAKELLSKGIRVDISLEDLRIDAPHGVDYFLWLPTPDYLPPTPDALALGVELLEFCAKRELPVYIHCRNGHGRAPTLLAAYLIKQGMTPTDAIANIKAKRPSIHITEAQMAGLKAYSKTINQ
jgi:protein-tyrosine phosphatase